MKWIFAPLTLLAACSGTPEHLKAPSPGTNLNTWATEHSIATLFSPTPIITTEQDDGCDVIRIRSSDISQPQTGADLNCNRIFVFWTQYDEPKFTTENKAVKEAAQTAIIHLTGDTTIPARLMKGETLRKESTPAGFIAQGGCALERCFVELSLR